MKMKLLLSVILITLFITSCGVLPNANNNLDGTAWTLVTYNGAVLLPETTMTAIFENGEVSGSASCNHYFGGYKTKGDQIEIDTIGWTEMACMDPEGIMEQEQELMSFLSKAATYSIQDQVLLISSGTGDLLEFHQIENRE